MTEATGGITMTPPGEYVDGSIGKPLPGIECVRAEDGELLIRGAYVSPGYLHPEGDEQEAHDAEGWFHTGDLVSIDAEGHFRITGRKKEIYKNRAGQTIAPQRVENLFRDFDDLSQAFLVGDHREYNTLLVWPNFEGRPELRQLSPEEMQHVVSSLVASANRFLAPFERVVAFRILDRALDVEHGELTHKLTFKRDVVEKNWKSLIDGMYQHRALSLSVDGIGLRIPNWVLRETGRPHRGRSDPRRGAAGRQDLPARLRRPARARLAPGGGPRLPPRGRGARPRRGARPPHPVARKRGAAPLPG